MLSCNDLALIVSAQRCSVWYLPGSSMATRPITVSRYSAQPSFGNYAVQSGF